MALPAKLTTLEGVDEVVAKEYKKVGEEFVLQVDKVGGLGLEDVSGLKSATESLRSEKKILEKEIRTVEKTLAEHREKFADLDPQTAKDAIEKLKTVSEWDGDKKIAEAVKLAVAEADAKSKERTDALLAKHNETVATLTTSFDGSQSQLRTALVTSRIVEAIAANGGDSVLLMPHVEKQVDMIKADDGKWHSQVLNKDGKPRIGDASTNADMTINELILEMKANPTYAPCFDGVGSTGSGKTAPTKGAKPKAGAGKIMHIRSDDQESIDKYGALLGCGKAVIDQVD